MVSQLEEILKLPKEERLLLAEALWDSVEEVSDSSWHISNEWREEIDRRYRLYKEGKTTLFTWEEVKQRLSKLK
jgi:putative addiction module component (TIGR02574 family)